MRLKVSSLTLLCVFVAMLLCLHLDAHADVVTADGSEGAIILTDQPCDIPVPDNFKQGAENVHATIYSAEHYDAPDSKPDIGCWYSAVPTKEDIAAMQQQVLQQAEDAPAKSPDDDPIKIILLANIYNGATVETIRLDKFKPMPPPEKAKDTSI